MNNTIQLVDWMMTGHYFGYPDCCIIAFIQRAIQINSGNIIDITENQRAVVDGNGFVPCDKCSKTLIKEGKSLTTLIRNRSCSEPYPREGSPEEYRKYLEEKANENETSK